MARREVRLDPKVQERLLEQMREEQAAALRSKAWRNYVLIPLLTGMTVAGVWMAFADDQTLALIGNLLASSILFVVWKLRKRIAAAFGFE